MVEVVVDVDDELELLVVDVEVEVLLDEVVDVD